MRRGKLIIVRTEQDIEAACKWMDDRERDMLEDLEETVADSEYEERARHTQERSSCFDDGW